MRVIDWRFFGGPTVEVTAGILKFSLQTVMRDLENGDNMVGAQTPASLRPTSSSGSPASPWAIARQ